MPAAKGSIPWNAGTSRAAVITSLTTADLKALIARENVMPNDKQLPPEIVALMAEASSEVSLIALTLVGRECLVLADVKKAAIEAMKSGKTADAVMPDIFEAMDIVVASAKATFAKMEQYGIPTDYDVSIVEKIDQKYAKLIALKLEATAKGN